jgi:hypothetical protein
MTNQEKLNTEELALQPVNKDVQATNRDGEYDGGFSLLAPKHCDKTLGESVFQANKRNAYQEFTFS